MSDRDFTIAGEGTVFVLTPHTKEARDWIVERISDEHQVWSGGIVVEHRYILDIVDGIRNDGLSIND